MKLRLRLSDTSSWAQEFDACCPAEIASGVRSAWAARIRHNVAQRLGSDLPLGATPERLLEARLAQVETWLADRLARQDATADARRSWEGQAAHWRFQAAEELGGHATLELHVKVPSGVWCNPNNRESGYRFSAAPMSPATAEAMWDGALRMIEHDLKICGVAKWVAREDQSPRELRLQEVREEMARRGLRVVTPPAPTTPER